jgi:hypothetical protein
MKLSANFCLTSRVLYYEDYAKIFQNSLLRNETVFVKGYIHIGMLMQCCIWKLCYKILKLFGSCILDQCINLLQPTYKMFDSTCPC